MDTIFYIDDVVKRLHITPDKYLPLNSVEMLSHFIPAYSYAITSVYQNPPATNVLFQLYVNTKFSVSKSIGWSQIISKHSKSVPFDTFFDLWDEFVSLYTKDEMLEFFIRNNKSVYVATVESSLTSPESIEHVIDVNSEGFSVEKELVYFLSKVREKPVLCLGEKSLLSLVAMIKGFTTALDDVSHRKSSFESDFVDFVNTKYPNCFVTCFTDLINVIGASEDGFVLFFELLDLYETDDCITKH